MKVKDLMELLQWMDGDTLIVMSSDGEGNSYSPLADFGESHYVAESSYSGELCEYDEEEDGPLDEWQPDGVPCLVLWPVN